MRLIDLAGPATAAAYSRSDVVEALNEQEPAAVAFASGQLVGVAVSRMAGQRRAPARSGPAPGLAEPGHRLGTAPGIAIKRQSIGAPCACWRWSSRARSGRSPSRTKGSTWSRDSTSTSGLRPWCPRKLEIVERYGGYFPGAGLWGEMKGFSTTKELLERRIVAPLSHAELADSVGLRPPAAVMLFGPPGTGKTSFARAIASRLSWAFVELHPSLLGPGTAGAANLRAALDDLAHVDRLVCFIDEADEIAAARATRPDSQPIVNELLKAIPIFRSRPDRLMVMATNSIASIDPAMLRPGRFDLIIPIGAPDSAGRAELAAEFLEKCDAEDIAERTEGFTPADFALAAQRAAQLAFERALAGGAPEVTSADCADAVSRTRPSVHSEAAAVFDEEATAFARF